MAWEWSNAQEAYDAGIPLFRRIIKAWSWSHTQEAYDAVQEGINNQDREWLEIVWAEWLTARKTSKDIHFHAEFDRRTYYTALARAKNKSIEHLQEQIWEWTEEYRTCTNGGWEAYCCPFGCIPHCISMSKKRNNHEQSSQASIGSNGI